MKAVVQSLKKGKSAGVDNFPAELVQEGGEDVNTALMTICGKIEQTGDQPVDPVLGYHTSKERQPAALPEPLNDQPHQPSKQSHAEDGTEGIEAASGEVEGAPQSRFSTYEFSVRNISNTSHTSTMSS